MEHPRSGDKCWVDRLGKRHYGICVGTTSAGRLVFIHNVPDGGVRYTTAEDFAKGRPIRVAQRAGAQADRVVRRARNLIGRQYDLVLFNCEHAANFAATGRAESPQVRRALAVAGAIGSALLLLNQNGTYLDGAGYRRDRSGRFAARRWF